MRCLSAGGRRTTERNNEAQLTADLQFTFFVVDVDSITGRNSSPPGDANLLLAVGTKEQNLLEYTKLRNFWYEACWLTGWLAERSKEAQITCLLYTSDAADE